MPMAAPVISMMAGARPTIAHNAFSHGFGQRPKCRRVRNRSASSPARVPNSALGSESVSTSHVNGSGTPM